MNLVCRVLLWSVVGVGVLGMSVHAFAADTKAAAKPATQVLKLDAKEVKGQKVWSPAVSTIKVNEAVTIEARNSLAAPHGLKIDGFIPETVIGAGETKTFTFTPTKKGELKVVCHLHPAHVAAAIKVQ